MFNITGKLVFPYENVVIGKKKQKTSTSNVNYNNGIYTIDRIKFYKHTTN